MAEYIERESLAKEGWYLQRFVYGNGYAAIETKKITDIPAADVRPVVRGKWEYTVIEGDVISQIPTVVKCVCSVCHNYSEEIPKWIYDDGGRIWFNFCPNCGADMRPPKEET